MPFTFNLKNLDLAKNIIYQMGKEGGMFLDTIENNIINMSLEKKLNLLSLIVEDEPFPKTSAEKEKLVNLRVLYLATFFWLYYQFKISRTEEPAQAILENIKKIYGEDHDFEKIYHEINYQAGALLVPLPELISTKIIKEQFIFSEKTTHTLDKLREEKKLPFDLEEEMGQLKKIKISETFIKHLQAFKKTSDKDVQTPIKSFISAVAPKDYPGALGQDLVKKIKSLNSTTRFTSKIDKQTYEINPAKDLQEYITHYNDDLQKGNITFPQYYVFLFKAVENYVQGLNNLGAKNLGKEILSAIEPSKNLKNAANHIMKYFPAPTFDPVQFKKVTKSKTSLPPVQAQKSEQKKPKSPSKKVSLPPISHRKK